MKGQTRGGESGAEAHRTVNILRKRARNEQAFVQDSSRRSSEIAGMKLEDVARQARVSVSTASRVLNNTGRVKATTRSRVLRIAQALRYRPDIHARSLAGGKSRTLGLIVSNLQNPFFLDIFRVVELDAHRYGYEVVVANTDYHPRRLVSSTHWMLGHRLAGLAVIVSEKELSVAQELTGSTIPVVFYDVGSPGPNVTNIRTNYDRGTQRVVEYLHSLGHRRMAFVGHHSGLPPLHDRKASFLTAVGRFQGEVESAIAAGSDSPGGGYQAMRHLLEPGLDPTAVICVNDFMALGVLRLLKERGLKVPEDVSVVGYDNIRLSEYACPPLTTVNVPREEIGHTICTALLPERGAAPALGREVVIQPELIVRDSTGPASRTRTLPGAPASGRDRGPGQEAP
jgi:DNA-binding LacI/PurR family transcriptional regulator